jgi:hypothetical protein
LKGRKELLRSIPSFELTLRLLDGDLINSFLARKAPDAASQKRISYHFALFWKIA